jgi:hypothetical protein
MKLNQDVVTPRPTFIRHCTRPDICWSTPTDRRPCECGVVYHRNCPCHTKHVICDANTGVTSTELKLHTLDNQRSPLPDRYSLADHPQPDFTLHDPEIFILSRLPSSTSQYHICKGIYIQRGLIHVSVDLQSFATTLPKHLDAQ